MPPADEPVSNDETVNPEVKRMDDIEIDDRLDLDKIKKFFYCFAYREIV